MAFVFIFETYNNLTPQITTNEQQARINLKFKSRNNEWQSQGVEVVLEYPYFTKTVPEIMSCALNT